MVEKSQVELCKLPPFQGDDDNNSSNNNADDAAAAAGGKNGGTEQQRQQVEDVLNEREHQPNSNDSRLQQQQQQQQPFNLQTQVPVAVPQDDPAAASAASSAVPSTLNDKKCSSRSFSMMMLSNNSRKSAIGAARGVGKKKEKRHGSSSVASSAAASVGSGACSTAAGSTAAKSGSRASSKPNMKRPRRVVLPLGGTLAAAAAAAGAGGGGLPPASSARSNYRPPSGATSGSSNANNKSNHDSDDSSNHHSAGGASASAGGEDPNDQQTYHQEDFDHFRQVLRALMLTTSLSAFSAMDAKEQCLKQETYLLLDLVDDDNFQKAYKTALSNESGEKCVHMFRYVLLPTLGVTLGFGFIGLVCLYCYSRNNNNYNNSNGNDAIIQNINCDGYFSRRTFKLTGELLLLSFGILCAQTYSIVAVMLRPRLMDTDETDNPYQSLAAVDRYGHVGDNANLYYLAWISECLTLALVYQLGTAFVQQSHHDQHQQPRASTTSHRRHRSLLPVPSWDHVDEEDQDGDESAEGESRALWFRSIYRLRFRTGIWCAALVACLVIVASSHHVWNQVVWPISRKYAMNQRDQQQQHRQLEYADWYYDDDDVGSGDGDAVNGDDQMNDDAQDEQEQQEHYHYGQVCLMYAAAGSSPQLCRRTVSAWLSGLVATGLCATAIGMHLFARRSATQRHVELKKERQQNFYFGSSSPVMWERVFVEHRFPLRTELLLSVLLSLLLACNAFLCTSVQGPASTVGNLYYSSWIGFLLVVRICLGCLEESYDISDAEHSHNDDANDSSMATTNHHNQANRTHRHSDSPQTENDAYRNMQSPGAVSISDPSVHSTMIDVLEKNRLRRLRVYFFLCIFSGVCASSAYDAASNQMRRLSKEQTYMILSPCVVTTLSAFLFVLCLSRRCYIVASHFCIGGVLAVLCFGLWLVDLVLTMHSEDSWAVDGIGEIKMANLYYFSWAGIITSGIQMMSYVKTLFGNSKIADDYMSIVWVAICKVCFVILGAALHIWHTISDNCEFDEITYGAVTFCSRTVMAIIVALAGMLVGGLVVLARLLLLYCSKCHTPFMTRLQAHVEMLTSMFLLLLFGAAVALITGIGGPGQSVGDLYYSTWLAFAVSLGIFVTCESQVRQQQTPSSSPPLLPPTTTTSITTIPMVLDKQLMARASPDTVLV